MAIGIVGIKRGMTRVFTEDGVSIPVTVVEADPNRIAQLKTTDVDGYEAVQITTGSRKANRITKAEAGHYKKAGVEAGRGLWEFRVNSLDGFEVGGEVKVDIFEAGQKVDVTGTSKGKGYAGAIKRWNFRGQDSTHGNSLSHRAPEIGRAHV